jgi:hypothetical protein
MRPAFLAIVISTLLASCTTSDDCGPDRACTMEYRMLTVSVRDSLNAPYLLDSTFTIKASTGEEIRPQQELFEPGLYTVLSDSEMDLTTRQGESFTFKGYRHGQLKVSEAYLIQHDCCHINLVAGNTYVILND